ncbi:23S rRNA pseudouridine(1911/1915/1917) synthase RluD [Teredinibacter purpureus]|jgi:ribosomal large subunit pseudouridine synthase D (EC 5.4.99.-)|uniref:23S rRNA pseudouridine(1911/1915/1917) synthase RluD n=1 Tax=Teredinibacter purpureus TaxID=2731756 RepID=UPI0005F886BA|nr:23S rRNA pseudouridine(1911/1915/1917) synthase RluD [Teredinibacter purpureus]
MPADTILTDEDPATPINGPISHHATVAFEKAGVRLDQHVAELFPDYSRSRLQQWIKDGALLLNGQKVKPKAKLAGGESITLEAAVEARCTWEAEPVEFGIVYEDDALLVVNKPAGLVVHPAVGNYNGTLLNGLLHHCGTLTQVPRAGIVHRLDKDTTGLMVVAKTEISQLNLVTQLQSRSVKRQYYALVHGDLRRTGTIETLMGRHPTHRIKMAVVKSGGKEAVTHYKPVATFDDFTLVELKLQTGRTHQIRVHMAHMGFPLVGDQTYGGKFPVKLLRLNPALQPLADFPRQALHAARLGLVHPVSGIQQEWEVELPEDMQALVELLEEQYA